MWKVEEVLGKFAIASQYAEYPFRFDTLEQGNAVCHLLNENKRLGDFVKYIRAEIADLE